MYVGTLGTYISERTLWIPYSITVPLAYPTSYSTPIVLTIKGVGVQRPVSKIATISATGAGTIGAAQFPLCQHGKLARNTPNVKFVLRVRYAIVARSATKALVFKFVIRLRETGVTGLYTQLVKQIVGKRVVLCRQELLMNLTDRHRAGEFTLKSRIVYGVNLDLILSVTGTVLLGGIAHTGFTVLGIGKRVGLRPYETGAGRLTVGHLGTEHAPISVTAVGAYH